MSRTKFMGIFLVILGVISIVVGIVRGDMFSSATMCIGYLLPIVLGAAFGNTNFSFGGTSVIIVVSVALETVAAIEAQMMMRHYKGFMK